MNEEAQAEIKSPHIYIIPLAEIDDFPGHPFKVKLDEDMDQLVASIKERGLITPITLRTKEDGRYEIVSGHRRKKACELAGLTTIKADVREMTRDEAIILMVESNLQRSVILPSEKAFSYKMRLEAMNRQGERTDLTSNPVGGKLQGKESAEILGDRVGDSSTQVRRYIRLTELIPPLLDLVDGRQIAFRPAVELSYLQKNEQERLLSAITAEDTSPSLAQATKMKKLSQQGELTDEAIDSILRNEEIASIEKPPEEESPAVSEPPKVPPDPHETKQETTKNEYPIPKVEEPRDNNHVDNAFIETVPEPDEADRDADDTPTLTTKGVIATIKAASLDFKGICEFYLHEFPVLLREEKNDLLEALRDIEIYLKKLHTGGKQEL